MRPAAWPQCWYENDSSTPAPPLAVCSIDYDNAVYRPQSGIYTAMGIGLALIALIIYAAIFAYR
jgi:hypothetical protein